MKQKGKMTAMEIAKTVGIRMMSTRKGKRDANRPAKTMAENISIWILQRNELSNVPSK